jgi:8-oxo-dGTP pyrophosphatase MutT (NUDIX family)
MRILSAAPTAWSGAAAVNGTVLTDFLLTATYRAALTIRRVQRRVFRVPTIGVRVLAVCGDQFILVRHRAGPAPWGLPGGGVGSRETFAAAALRELREEAGVIGTVTTLHGVFQHWQDGNPDTVVVLCAVVSQSPCAPRRDLEIAAAGLFSADHLPAGTDAASRRRIEEYRQQRSALVEAW